MPSSAAGPVTSSPRRVRNRTTHPATVVFWVMVPVSAGVILWLGRDVWFKGDEWLFLAQRDISLRGLFEPHNLVHWTTLPVALYRLLYRVVGLHSYLPYQVPVLALHLLTAGLLHRIMLRSRVQPWIALAAASVFLLFGSGYPNLIWGFQVSLNASVALGLVHLLAADHSGRVGRRDGLGLAAGVAGLMCSGIAVTMAFVVGLHTLVRRGWRRAALHTAPLGAIHLVWWFGYARSDEADALDRGMPGQWLEFLWIGLRSTFGALGQLPGTPVVLAVVFLGGWWLALRTPEAATDRGAITMPLCLAVGAVVGLIITAQGRVAASLGELDVVLGPDTADSPRYLYVTAALLTPALGVAADAVARRWPRAVPALCALLVSAIPGNLSALADPAGQSFQPDVIMFTRDSVTAAPRIPLAEELPGWTEPLRNDKVVTLGWLRGADRAGRLPESDASPRLTNTVTLRLALDRLRTPLGPCEPVAFHGPMAVDHGDFLRFDIDPGTTVGFTNVSTEHGSAVVAINLSFSPIVQVLAGPLHIRIEPDDAIHGVSICTAPAA